MGGLDPRRDNRGRHLNTKVNLIFVTQLVDFGDPVLGFVVPLIRALEARSGPMLVIANEVRHVPSDLRAEVRSLGKEHARGKLARGVRYQTILAEALRRLRPATVIAHMCPPYLTQAAPMVKLTGGRSMLWYIHPADTPMLRRAERAADMVLTALPGSFPRQSAKVHPIGHSIDLTRFDALDPPPGGGGLRLLGLGRLAPIKGYPVMVRALRMARDRGTDVRLDIVGEAIRDSDVGHREELRLLVERLGVEDAVSIRPGVAPAEVPGLLAQVDALVNATAAGSADKVVFEAMACGRPPLVSSPAFHDLVGSGPVPLSFRAGDPADLADRITQLANTPPRTRVEMAAMLRSRIEGSHSLTHWADAVVRLATHLHRH